MKKTLLYFLLCLVVIACKNSNENTEEPAARTEVDLAYFFTKAPEFEVIENPSGKNPLAVKINFKTGIGTKITVKVDGKLPVEKTFDGFSFSHSVPVIGLYAQTKNTITLTLEDSTNCYATKQFTVYTPPIRDYIPDVTIVKADTANMVSGWTFAEVAIGQNGSFFSTPFIFDPNGDIRWIWYAASGDQQWAFEVENGLLRSGGLGAINYFNYVGENVKRISLEYPALHHDLQLGNNGNYLAIVNYPYSKPIHVNGQVLNATDDYVMELNRNGGIVRAWDLADVLDVQRVLIPTGADWFHANSVWWDAPTETLVVSGRHQGIVGLDINNKLKWILASRSGWSDSSGPLNQGPSVKSKLLTAVNAQGVAYGSEVQNGTQVAADGFEWPWLQHAVMVMPNGNLLCFDNNIGRTASNAGDPYSRAVEYKVDPVKMTVQQVWQYKNNFSSTIVSDVDYDEASKHRFITSGVDGYIIELNENNEEVFRAKLHFKNKLGNGQMAWGQFDLMYRSERLPLYF